MKRTFPIGQEFLVKNAEVVVSLTQPEVGSLALEVTLLRCELSSALTLRSPTGRRLELSLRSADVRAIVHKVAPTQFRFKLAHNHGEYLQAFLLRAYRDEMADVNHIHLEGEMGGKAMDLTFMFQVHKPPISGEEASRLMGD